MADEQHTEALSLNVKDAAATLGMSVTQFKRHVLPDLHVARLTRKTVLVPRRELDRWLQRNATRD